MNQVVMMEQLIEALGKKAEVMDRENRRLRKRVSFLEMELKSIRDEQAENKSTLDMTIKEVARIGLPKIIQIMRGERANYLAGANKLEKAINLLNSLQKRRARMP